MGELKFNTATSQTAIKLCLPHIGRPNESTLIVGGILSFVIILISGVCTLGFIILIIQNRGRKPKL